MQGRDERGILTRLSLKCGITKVLEIGLRVLYFTRSPIWTALLIMATRSGSRPRTMVFGDAAVNLMMATIMYGADLGTL